MTAKPNKLISLLPTVIIGILLVISILTSGFNFKKEPEVVLLSAEEAGRRAIGFIEKNIPQDQTASLKNIADFNSSGLYKFQVDVGGQNFDSYITRDGKLLFPQAVDLEAQTEASSEEESSTEIPKKDIPDVKLFVMSYCPYGLQAQKGILPVYNLLKNKANISIHFVDYIMHDKKEIDENLRQYCIQSEQKEKFGIYLSCFVKDGEASKCLSQAGIDEAKLNSCIINTDKKYKITEQYNDKSTWLNGQYPKFDVDTALNEKYGVQGSPTIVINDKVVRISSRTPEKFKEVICQSFNSSPEECSQTLSSETPSPGFGEASSSSSGGSCQ